MSTDTQAAHSDSTPAQAGYVACAGQRSAEFEASGRSDGDARIPVVISTDAPVEMPDGVEVLVHEQGAIDMTRAPLPIIVTHRGNQINVGLVEDMALTSQAGVAQLRGLARFGQRAEAAGYAADVESGVIRSVSVGYRRITGRVRADGVIETTRWLPTHVALVAEPADTGAGFYRGAPERVQYQASPTETKHDKSPADESAKPNSGEASAAARSLAAEAVTAQPTEIPTMSDTTAAPAAPQQPDIRVIETTAARRAHERVTEILAIGRAHQMDDAAQAAMADPAITVDAFRQQVLDKLVERGALKPAASSPAIGLSPREIRGFSIARLMYALMEPNDREAQRAAGLEIEASVAARKLRPMSDDVPMSAHRAAGFTVPWDVLADREQSRDLTVGTTTAAGNLVATNLAAGSFIDLLRNRIVLAGMGARMLDGLVGNLAIPKQTGGATSYWVTEGNAPTESQLTTGQVSLTPKTVGAYSDYTRRALLQTTPAIESLVRADLAASLAVAIDTAGINGSGSSGEPTGVINTAGIGAVAGGTNGAAPTYAHMIALEEQIAIDNADVANMRFLTNAKMRAQLRGTQEFSSTNGVAVWRDDGTVLGYGATVTNSVPSTLTKGSSSGVCSAILLGNWADLIIGMWGGLDLMLDPYALATSGGRRVIALQDVDVAVRRAESFAAMLDALRT